MQIMSGLHGGGGGGALAQKKCPFLKGTDQKKWRNLKIYLNLYFEKKTQFLIF